MCGTRYYDPEIGRFISPDNIEVVVSLGAGIINGLNLYSYCFNNPITYIDDCGYFPKVNINPWRYRIDPPKRSSDQKHIHLMLRKNEMASQNLDGTIYDRKKFIDNPPPWVADRLREAGIWDYKDMFSNLNLRIPSFNSIPIYSVGYTMMGFPLNLQSSTYVSTPLIASSGDWNWFPSFNMPNFNLEWFPNIGQNINNGWNSLNSQQQALIAGGIVIGALLLAIPTGGWSLWALLF